MTHFGAVCNPGPSHVMAMMSLGGELQKRGHRFTFFAPPDLADVAQKHGISFQPLDSSNYLPEVNTFLERIAQGRELSYSEMLRYGRGEIAYYCEQAPKAMNDAGVECLIGDQMVVAGRTVAERLSVPYVTLCNAIPISSDPDVPPSSAPWRYRPTWWAHCLNWTVYRIFALFATPISRKLNAYRREWNLAPHRNLDETFSPLAQITQMVREFDFPFQKRRKNLYYVGPYRRERQSVDFPYGQLDGRPLIFGALGTHLGATTRIWRTIAESCLDLDAQLVISLGGRGRPENYRDLPGRPLVVAFAPQRELLKRATLMITHGGLNSVMEALAEGVPLITLPAFGDQPGVAMRVATAGVGESLSQKSCRTDTLRPFLKRVFTGASYKAHASVLQNAIHKTRGIQEAADIVERVIKCP